MLNRDSAQTDSAKPGDPRNAGIFTGSVVLSDATIPPTVAPLNREGDGRGDACLLVEASLSAYLDEELDPAQMLVVETHLTSCSRCGAQYRAAKRVDRMVEREWQQEMPLPSSFTRKRNIDSIMDALPPAPPCPADFDHKRRHVKTRWTRLASGLAALLILLGMLWSSYHLGYTHGRQNTPSSMLPPSMPPPPAPHF